MAVDFFSDVNEFLNKANNNDSSTNQEPFKKNKSSTQLLIMKNIKV